jgi:hypothetical protein
MRRSLSNAMCAALITACALAVTAGPAGARAGWSGNHFINSAKTIECKGFFLEQYQSVELVCSNTSNRIAVITAHGTAITFSYDWSKNVVGFGRVAHILTTGRYTGWGVTCRAGASWAQCGNSDGHGVLLGRTSIQKF